MTISKYPTNTGHANRPAKANVTGTLARLVKENATYRETLKQIMEKTAFASDDITTVGWIHKAARNALASVNLSNDDL